MLNGKKLQYLRVLKNISQKYMADAIGISERWVGKIENEGENPSQDVYDKWLQVIYGNLKPVKKDVNQDTKKVVKKK